MGNKSKGSNAERELIHLLWSQNWAASRVAGSGTMRYPSPDIIASKEGKHAIIECKLTKEEYKYIPKEDIHELNKYAQRSGINPYIAIRFHRTPWYFLTITQLKETEQHYIITKQDAIKNGKKIEEI